MDQASSVSIVQIQGPDIDRPSHDFGTQLHDTAMSTQSGILPVLAHSSREPSAAVSEWERKAEEEARAIEQIHSRTQLLQQQQAALNEEVRLRRENIQKYKDQADSERQYAAMVASLEEVEAEKQDQFRTGIADEVFGRVARSLRKEGAMALSSVKAVVDRSYASEDQNVVETCLFRAISGNDKQFIERVADRVYEEYQKDPAIDANTIEFVKASKICLDAGSIAKNSSSNEAATEVLTEPVEKIEQAGSSLPDEQETGITVNDVNDDAKAVEADRRSATPVSEVITVARSDGSKLSESSRSQEKTKSEDIVIKEEDNQDKVMKEETRARRTSMLQLDEETGTNRSRRGSTTAFSRFSLSHERNIPAVPSVDMDFMEEDSRSTSKKSASGSRKRRLEDEESSNDDEETISRASEPVKPKKKQKPLPKTPKTSIVALTRFKTYIEKQAKAQKLAKAAFECSECGKDMCTVDKPRITQNCQHLYCGKCITEVRAQQKKAGTGTPNKVQCVHTGCSSTTGPMAILDNKDVRKLKTDIEDKIREVDDDEADMCAEKTDEESSDSDGEATSDE